MIRVSLLAVAVIALDQLTKAVALERLPPGVPVELTPWLALTLVMNPGLAFGVLGGRAARLALGGGGAVARRARRPGAGGAPGAPRPTAGRGPWPWD